MLLTAPKGSEDLRRASESDIQTRLDGSRQSSIPLAAALLCIRSALTTIISDSTPEKHIPDSDADIHTTAIAAQLAILINRGLLAAAVDRDLLGVPRSIDKLRWSIYDVHTYLDFVGLVVESLETGVVLSSTSVYKRLLSLRFLSCWIPGALMVHEAIDM